MLTQEDKLYFFHVLKEGSTPFLNGKIYESTVDGVKMGTYSSALPSGSFRTLFRGPYEDCLKWRDEAHAFWDELKKAWAEVELKQLRELGLDI